jgi:hypothetical protein
MTDQIPDELRVPLRDYFERMIADRDARIQIALTASKEAVAKAEQANERRLDLLNEFRGQQADEARKYALSTLVEQQFNALDQRVARNETLTAGLQGRALALAGFGAVFGGVITGLIVRLAG